MSDHEPQREPIEPPGGFSPKSRPDDLSALEPKPDWLTGADDGIDFTSPRKPDTDRPTLLRPGGAAADPARETAAPAPVLRLGVPGAASPKPPEPESESIEPVTEAWGPAASSIPKLTVVPQRERPSREAPEDLGRVDRLEVDGEGEPSDGELTDEAAQAPPEEPWWLVAVETLATNRLLQIGIAVVAVAIAAWVFWPRKENQTTAIAAIKQHPQRFEGQSVRIRGEVGEVFDVGSGVVFELHQRRDTLVVFSPSRRPALHDRLVIQGTVSTGYLDGTPRVALFEAPGAIAH